MKITTLIENLPGDDINLKYEHGLSFFIEVGGQKILFDTGKTGDFIKNATIMNLDLKLADKIILSHGHYDHCGGVRDLLETYDNFKELYVGECFFKNKDKYRYYDKYKTPKYIGIDFDEDYIIDKGIKIKYVKEDITKLSEGVYIFTNFDKNIEFEKINYNLRIKKDNEYIIDQFEDEIAMGLDTENGLLILLGCSHPGVLNMIETIINRTNKKIYGIVGGTHLKEADVSRIQKTMEYLKELDIKLLGFSHCTGEVAGNMFKAEFNQFSVNRTGSIIEIDEV